jgi:putative ABC transport system permease protein
MMGLYVRDELSFDAFHEKADRLYRVNCEITMGGQAQSLALASAPFGPALASEYPTVEAACRFRQWGFINVKKGDESIEEGANTYVDSTFFSLFSIPLLEGDPATALAAPNTGVISERIARKYFGASAGVVGKTLRINDSRDMRITGVMQNIPAQSHFHYDFLFSMSTIAEEANQPVWLSNNFQTYLLLRPDADPAAVQDHFHELIEKYIGPQLLQLTGSSLADFKASGNRLAYDLQNIRDIHLHSDRAGEHEANSDIKYVWIFSSVALIVLLLACVNFMNLSTARSSNRAREVGVRKALGSSRGALVRQFLTESLVLTLAAFALAVGAVWAALPYFNQFADKDIQLSLWNAPALAALAGLALATAVVSGSYPAFYLSSFRPIQTLKGTLEALGRGASWLRSGLVVFQFLASVVLITGVLTVRQQLHFIQQKKLGYDKERLLMLRNTWWLQQQTLDFKNRLSDIPGVNGVSCTDYFPTPSPRSSYNFYLEGQDVATASVPAQHWQVDFDYSSVMGLRLREGRWFDPQLPTDSARCVLNAAAVKALGLKNPVGARLSTFVDPSLQHEATYEVAGVVEDFHFESLRFNIEPLVMTIGRGSGTMALRLSPQADLAATVAGIEKLFKAYLPGQPFNYRFIDDEFDQQYRSERRIGGILGGFASLAVFIACLGLFGLAAYMAEQRTKEIGIRKVLGAGVLNLAAMLSGDFLKWVLLAAFLAVPLAWWSMNSWLQDFAYRIELSVWTFAAAAGLAMLIALLTVSAHAIRAALANPVKSLRSE